MSDDIKANLGPTYQENHAINVIASAFEIRDKHLSQLMHHVVEGFKTRDQQIMNLEHHVSLLLKKVEALEDNKVDEILLKGSDAKDSSNDKRDGETSSS